MGTVDIRIFFLVIVSIYGLTRVAEAAPFNGSGSYTTLGPLENGNANETMETPYPTMLKGSWADEFVIIKDKQHLCEISTEENLHEFIDIAEEEENVNLFEFTIRLKNYTENPLYNTTGLFFKPWLWYTTRSRHGRTLLMLSFHYDVLSMNILTIGVKKIPVDIIDHPFGCFGRLSTASQVKYIRMLLLNRDVVGQSSSYGKSAREEFACNQEIMNVKGDAEFVYNCCFKNPSGNLVCSTKGDDFWINILYFAITSVKILMFLFCPKFLPNNVYSAAYMASQYVVNLKKKVKMNVFISEKTDTQVRFKNRVTLENISDFWAFREFLDTLPMDEVVPIEMTDLKLKVKGKRIIPENDPPTGLLKTIYDNLIRCKIRNLDPFKECCDTSIFVDRETTCRHQITWHQFVTIFVKGLMLILLPFPYYIRLFIYFKFEADEVGQRRAAAARNDLGESFNFYKTNVIQFFSPFHGVFIATYLLYFVTGLVIGFSAQTFREQLKVVARSALTDQNAVSQTGVLGIIIRVLLYPFKRYGLLGFLVGPLYLILVLPLCGIVFTLYCIPTVYLSFRLPYHARKLLGSRGKLAVKEIEKRRRLVRLAKMKKFGKRFSKMDKFAHRGDMASGGDSCIPDEWGFDCESLKNLAIQMICSIFCLCILYSIALVFAESIGLFVEVMAFTMMGIIVNAGSVLKYVSMVLLVFVYMNDCYSNVYENYLTFNKTIIDEIIDRTEADLRKIASMPSSQQANTAFVVKCVDEEKEMIPTLNFEKKEIRWKLGQLLLFLDCFDTPRIPLKLFQKLCQVRVHGAPGPVYINLLAATGKFMIIVIFLMFVMIVVMAFGNVYAMSSTNTTLATLAGGFVPMLLKNVLSSKGARLSLKTVSFKGQIDEIIGDYKQCWPIVDLLAAKYTPEEEEEEGEGDGEDKDGKKDDGDDGDKKGGGGGGKDGDTSKSKGDKEKNDNKEGKDGKSAKDEKKDSVDSKAGKDSKVNGAGEKSDKGKDNDEKTKKEDDKNNGIPGNLSSPRPSMAYLSLPRASIFPVDEEPFVDLFVDLSVADTAAGWSLSGSTESLPSTTLMPEGSLMPGYFDPNIIVENETKNQTIYYNARDDKPPSYRREDPRVTFHDERPV